MSVWTLDDIASLSIPGLTDVESLTVKKLFSEWSSRLNKNLKRSLYYDGEQSFQDLGLMLPPQLKNAKFYLGWANMAVRKAAIRSQFEGLTLPGDDDDPYELGEVFDANNFQLELSQAIVSAYKHGPSFVTVAKGGPGESAVQIQPHSAESASALWDRRRRRISAALTISEVTEGSPTGFIVYFDDYVLRCDKARGGGWVVERIANKIGRVLVVPLTYDPQINKPFGRSRISNPVMALTDMAVRAYVRMEGNAEFYSSPQIAIEGIDPEAFDSNPSDQRKFKLAMDRLIALTRDEDGNAPNIKQLQQATMTPHSDMLRTVAQAFSGETGIPPSSLGIIHDNPSSAEAIRAAEHDLLIDVTYQNKYVLSTAVKEIAKLAVMVRDGSSTAPEGSWQLGARFSDPEFRSTSANADAYVKLVGGNPALASSSVLLETVFDPSQVKRVQADLRGSTVSTLVESLRNRATEAATPAPVVAALEARGVGGL